MSAIYDKPVPEPTADSQPYWDGLRDHRLVIQSCANCGKAIHAKRLEVAPWARYCVPCQELEEQGLLPVAGENDDEALDDEDVEEAEETA